MLRCHSANTRRRSVYVRLDALTGNATNSSSCCTQHDFVLVNRRGRAPQAGAWPDSAAGLLEGVNMVVEGRRRRYRRAASGSRSGV